MHVDAVPYSCPALNRNNHRAYQRRRVLRQYGAATGWLDAGEQYAFDWVRGASQGRAILDIGIGGGRTAPLLNDISSDYCGIDYAPAMVAMARARFPQYRFEIMDARALTFADNTFDLAAFTYNGIDSIDLAGRQQALHEVYRVLTPGGHFVFSALNPHGTARAPAWPDWLTVRGAGLSPVGYARGCARLLIGGLNRLRHAGLRQNGGDLAIGEITAHDFALVVLFMSIRGQLRHLQEAGFDTVALFEPGGASIGLDGEQTRAPWCYYVARKPEAPRRGM